MFVLIFFALAYFGIFDAVPILKEALSYNDRLILFIVIIVIVEITFELNFFFMPYKIKSIQKQLKEQTELNKKMFIALDHIAKNTKEIPNQKDYTVETIIFKKETDNKTNDKIE